MFQEPESKAEENIPLILTQCTEEELRGYVKNLDELEDDNEGKNKIHLFHVDPGLFKPFRWYLYCPKTKRKVEVTNEKQRQEKIIKITGYHSGYLDEPLKLDEPQKKDDSIDVTKMNWVKNQLPTSRLNNFEEIKKNKVLLKELVDLITQAFSSFDEIIDTPRDTHKDLKDNTVQYFANSLIQGTCESRSRFFELIKKIQLY